MFTFHTYKYFSLFLEILEILALYERKVRMIVKEA